MEVESTQPDSGVRWAKWDTQDAESISVFDLHTAASVGHEESVKQLISRINIKVNLDKKNKGGWTPLMYAAYCDHNSIVALLLQHGAGVNLHNFAGQSPLMLASMCGNEKCARTLLQGKANIEDQDNQGCTALFHAANSGHQNIVRLLLQCGANPNVAEKKQGMTPLMVSVSARHESIVKDLLQQGADANTLNFKGESAKSIAISKGYENILNMLETFFEPKANHDKKDVKDEQKLQDGPLMVANILERCQINKSPSAIIPLPAQHLFSSPSVFNDVFMQQRRQSDATQPQNLQSLLEGLGLSNYFKLFEEQDVDLQVFLTLGDAELKEVGVNLLGPRRKMTAAINRWHQRASVITNSSEQAFANRLMIEKEKLAVMVDQNQKLLTKEKQLRAAMEKNLSEIKAGQLECFDLITRHTSQLMNLIQQLKATTSTFTQNIQNIDPSITTIDENNGSASEIFNYVDGLVEKLAFHVSLIQNTVEERKVNF